MSYKKITPYPSHVLYSVQYNACTVGWGGVVVAVGDLVPARSRQGPGTRHCPGPWLSPGQCCPKLQYFPGVTVHGNHGVWIPNSSPLLYTVQPA